MTASTTSPPRNLSPGSLPLRSSKVVDLNLLKVRVATNLEDFAGYGYFPREAADTTPADYEIYCIDLDRDDFDTDDLDRCRDRTLRAKRFRSGYYLSHIFGDPAYLVTRGNASFVFGRRLERTLWPYFVKRVLTDFALDHGYLHLKAGGFTTAEGGTTLLFGPNGGGKTVFLSQACRQDGVDFLTNTHVLVRDGEAHGVPSAVRVRADPRLTEMTGQGRLTAHLEEGDLVAPPELLFPHTTDRGRVRNLVVCDYDPGGRQCFEPITAEQAETFLDQFGFAVTTYGLKDDVLAHYGRDFTSFTAGMRAMKDQLAQLVRGARCYRANVDMLDPAVRTEVLRTLAAGPDA
ncbi:FomB family phosphonate monophosphate kinase (plasmid) [Streptomyces sp. HUAS TT11]|uniref:FomB family phosphonate monophosphate kinase n=1 Tax=Streptomyces sp. HUAS TT11 TaxID=3447508 RepID=UPI003F660808